MAERPKPMTPRPRTSVRRIAEPWTVVVFITALFHFFRGAPIDGLFFLAITVLLIADALGWVRIRLPAMRLPRLTTLIGLAPRHGLVEGLIVSAIGVSVLAVAWESGGERAEKSRALRKALVLFTAVGVFGCLIEVSSYLLGLASPEAMFEHPSVSLLLDPFVDTPVGRIIFTGLWLAAGIWFLRRARGRETP